MQRYLQIFVRLSCHELGRELYAKLLFFSVQFSGYKVIVIRNCTKLSLWTFLDGNRVKEVLNLILAAVNTLPKLTFRVWALRQSESAKEIRRPISAPSSLVSFQWVLVQTEFINVLRFAHTIPPTPRPSSFVSRLSAWVRNDAYFIWYSINNCKKM